MNYHDIAFAAVAVCSLSASALMFAYQKITPGAEVVMIGDQDARLSRIEKRLDDAVAAQEVMIRKIEELRNQRDAHRVKRDED